MKNLIERLRQYSQSLIAYKLGADFSDAVCKAADTLESHTYERSAMIAEIENLQEELSQVKAERDAAVNELCYKCGNYEQAHNGWCDHCRWKKEAQ